MQGKKVYRFTTLILFAASLCLQGQTMSTKEYISVYKFAAMQEMKVYRIPASITLAQGILESGSGNSKLSTDCNNHFGIKCRKNWTGATCLADDDAPNECFRAYGSAMESYRDHSMFLQQSERYTRLFSLMITDYNGWARGLRECGYATNPAYADLLTGVIVRYRLTVYDSMVLLGDDYKSPDSAAQIQIRVNGLVAIMASKGDSPESIAKRMDLGAWQIYKYNDLKKGETIDPGEIVYLKPKRRKGNVESHVVKEGESLREISQEHGIRLKQLQMKNRLKPGQQVSPGEILYLRKKVKQAPRLTVAAPVEPKPEVVKATPPTPNVPDSFSRVYHEVQPGETLQSIALKFGLQTEDLLKWNKLQDGLLKTGQMLLIRNVSMEGAGKDGSSPATEKQIETSLKYHVVVSGETLYSISRIYNIGVDSIKRWNALNGNSIKTGQELKIFSPSKFGNQNTEPSVPLTYTVQPGETLYSISRKYGLSVKQLMELNHLIDSNIKPGQALKLR